MKYHIISILHIMKLHEHIIYAHCIHYIEYNFDYCIHQWGGNLCKYAYHLLYINATFIRLSTNIVKIYHFSCNFCIKISQKLYKISHFCTKIVQKITKKYTFYHIFYTNTTHIHNLSTNNCG